MNTMAKSSKVTFRFVCQECGAQSPKWLGKCPSCGVWDSYVEEKVLPQGKTPTRLTRSNAHPIPITKLENENFSRIRSSIAELDRVLGGGFVPGSVVLVGGDPGIGKSTIALQMLDQISSMGASVLYVTGEESPNQVKLRADRLGLGHDSLMVFAETSLESIIDVIDSLSPAVVVIDSIQTIHTVDIPSSTGSVGQLRECTSKLIEVAKIEGPEFFLIGHVTKDGAIAGPKVLEHLVDTVLYFEGGRGHPFRILRAVKNRFGSTNEIGVFEMRDRGLLEVSNPSEIFLSERPMNAPGSIVVPTIEGSRTILVEIQSLVSSTNMGVPRRTTIGLDHNRVSLLVAVLEKRAGLEIIGNDIFMNVAGGVRVDEPATDLGMCISLVSSLLNKPVEHDLAAFGEVGLAGEVRGVAQVETRLKEVEKLGFKTCVLPAINLERLSSEEKNPSNIKLIGVKTIDEAIEAVLK